VVASALTPQLAGWDIPHCRLGLAFNKAFWLFPLRFPRYIILIICVPGGLI